MCAAERRGDMTAKMKKILITLSLAFIVCVSLTSLVIAYAGGIRGAGLLGVWFFFTFGIVVVLSQLIPAGILLASFVASIFRPIKRSEMPA
jgi:hypothetical protein